MAVVNYGSDQHGLVWGYLCMEPRLVVSARLRRSLVRLQRLLAPEPAALFRLLAYFLLLRRCD